LAAAKPVGCGGFTARAFSDSIATEMHRRPDLLKAPAVLTAGPYNRILGANDRIRGRLRYRTTCRKTADDGHRARGSLQRSLWDRLRREADS